MAPDSPNALTEAPTPTSLGYRVPAEWAPHAATWFSWPHNRGTWPGHLERAERVLAQAVGALREGETVRINVLDAEHEAHVRKLLDGGEAAHPVLFHHIPTNDAWCRDHGAIFVVRDRNEAGDGRLAATDWGYNAWGGKYPPYDLDNAVPRKMADVLDVPRFEADIILEGGSIDVNGAGLLLTTEACLLNPNRNPGLTRAEIEGRLRAMLSAEQVLWLEGELAGDDTDGHIDNLARFVAEDTVVAAVEDDPADVNHAPLQDNLGRLRRMSTTDGRPLRVLELPMPTPVYADGNRLPASYANFYIGNRVVLLPAYGGPNDRVAQERLQALFPRRRVVPLDCTDVAVGLGAFHCLTQQVPLGE